MRPLQVVRLLAAVCLSPKCCVLLGWALPVTASCPAAHKPSQYHCLQVLYNILGNALKFTSTGHVGVLVKPTADMKSVVFTVRTQALGFLKRPSPASFCRLSR